MARLRQTSLVTFIVSLRWNLLGWFFLNLGLVLVAMIGFLRAEFGLGASSLLGGSMGKRLDAVARPLATELRRRPPSTWDEALARAVKPYLSRGELSAALVDDQGNTLAGSLPTMPPNVRSLVVRTPREGSGTGTPDDKRLVTNNSTGGKDKFMVISTSPRLYWAGVYLQDVSVQLAGGPRRLSALVLASGSLRGGGLFFNYTPWLLLGVGLLLLSTVLWLPFLRRLTRGLTDMTHVAERIAEGYFQTPRISSRGDELGRLGRALANMAARLEGYVKGQKRFLGDTAHELLSPLARLEVGLSILEQRAVPADVEIVERSLGEVRHLAGIVQDLLLFTKSELRAAPVVLQSIPLAGLARSVARREGMGGAIVKVDIAEELCALADRDLLDRALGNAVRNAVRYAGHAGPITVFAASSEETPDEVRLTIFDEGPGAPEATLKQLFDPFFRPETARTRETGGTGLGLAIVKSCVEACGGTVSARNRTSNGLAVTFQLRRAGGRGGR